MHHFRPLTSIALAALFGGIAACGDTTEPGTGAVATVTISPAGPTQIEIGQELPVSVTLRDAAGTILVERAITITSSNPSVARFEPGFVIGVSEGTASLTAVSEGKGDTLELTVVIAAVANVSVAPVRADIWPAESEVLVAVARDARGATLTGRPVTWSSNDTTVARVSPTGVVIGVAQGTAMISATVEGVSQQAEIAVQAPVTFARLAAGVDHTCGVTTAQGAFCWGRGELGQLGVGLAEDRDSPRRLSGALQWLSVAGHAAFSCAASTGNQAYCFGTDDRHRLGNDTVTDICGGVPCRTEPSRRVIGTQAFVQVTAGLRHGCGLTTGGAVYCWGDQSQSQIGSDTATYLECGSGQAAVQCTERPVLVRSSLTFTAVTAGDFHTCALTSAGAAYCWGAGGSGRLGNGATATQAAPVLVSGGHTWADLSAGATHTCGVTTGGAAYCWGLNSSGQLGTGDNTNRTSPTLVTGGLTWSDVGAGGTHTCGVVNDGSVRCWGQGSSGQLGTGAATSTNAPATVTGGLTFASVTGGGSHSCGLTTGGVAYCWGANARGQLGLGTIALTLDPTRVLGQN